MPSLEAHARPDVSTGSRSEPGHGLAATAGWTLLLAGVGLAVLLRGGFPPALGVLALGVSAAGTGLLVRSENRMSRQWLPRWSTAAVLALTTWWTVAAAGWGRVIDAAPLTLALLLFLVVGAGTARYSAGAEQVRELLALGGAWYAAVGLLGVALRVAPLSLPAQGLERLAGTVTYANASGALLGAVLVVSVAGSPAAARERLQVLLVTCGLVATMSRGAMLAVLLALALQLRDRVPVWWRELAAGLVVGLVFVGTSATAEAQWLPLMCLVVGAGVLALRPLARQRSRRWSAQLLAAPVVVAVLILAGGRGLLAVLRERLGAADRWPEWAAAWRVFLDDPVLGAGPGRHLPLGDGTLFRYAHSEPLQVLAASGLVGGALLLAVVVGLVRSSRALDPAGRAALLVVLVCCAVDFVAHVPAVLAVLGLVLASHRRKALP